MYTPTRSSWLPFLFRSHLPQTLGRTALLATILGLLLGINILICSLCLARYVDIITLQISFLSNDRLQLIWQWSAYWSALCIFHLMEFFTTAIWNPTVATATSFLVNHSQSYTAAALVSWTEFWIRFLWFSAWNFPLASTGGVLLVVAAQAIRSTAMIHCGESFNHIIQRNKKENHVLVTTGIYSLLRHPSYVGFFYWSVGTQLILGNPLSLVAYTAASWVFFRKRIPYEEGSLQNLFRDDYSEYAKRTWMGIPFIPSCAVDRSKEE